MTEVVFRPDSWPPGRPSEASPQPHPHPNQITPGPANDSSRAAGLPSARGDFLLVLRFVMINLVAFGLVAVAYQHGLIQTIAAADGTGLSMLIAAVFAVGLAGCAVQIWRTGRQLDEVHRGRPHRDSAAGSYLAGIAGKDSGSRSLLAMNLRLRLTQRIAYIRHIAGSLVLLGLIGTVIGFIIALSGVNPDRVTDVSAVPPMVSTLIAGMSTALYTTLVGSVLNIWLMLNYHLLLGGTIRLAAAATDLGEAHGRA